MKTHDSRFRAKNTRFVQAKVVHEEIRRYCRTIVYPFSGKCLKASINKAKQPKWDFFLINKNDHFKVSFGVFLILIFLYVHNLKIIHRCSRMVLEVLRIKISFSKHFEHF